MVWYPTFEDVVNIHIILMQELDEAPRDVIDPDKIESALARPKQHAWYEQADLMTQSAYLMGGPTAAHGLLDGNKRTALAVTDHFLERNGFILYADRELEDMLVAVVEANSNQQDDKQLYDALIVGIGDRVKPVSYPSSSPT